MSKEQMRRELDVWGKRDNHVQDRPHIEVVVENMMTMKHFIV